MLSQAGIKFEAIAPECDEDSIKLQKKHLELKDLALELAKAKALSLSNLYKNSYVIGSDQICEFEGSAISKSKNRQEAFESLKKLQGKSHKQNNGTCIYYNDNPVMEFKDTAILTMKPLSDAEIWAYIDQDNPVGCAGSYKYELNGHKLFSSIQGNAECIQGFGLTKVVEFLNKIA